MQAIGNTFLAKRAKWRDGHRHRALPGSSLPSREIINNSPVRRAYACWLGLALVLSLAVNAPPALAEQEGSAARRHWAFEPVKKVEPPKRGLHGSENPIDRFILAKLREQKLKPVDLATKRTLVRRAYFDLIGLPPTPEELNAFLNDKSPRAWSNLVERLLASPHYGERWGRHWMDVVRYADTAGDNADFPIPEGYLYRDYIIDSFNADKSYD